jgi:hypothetical protein
MKNIRNFGLIILLVIAGCTTSRITSTWKDKNVFPQKYNKIMILGLIREEDRSMQIDMENHMVGDLKDLGYNAISSFAEFGPKAFDKMTEAEALNKLKNSGVDAVITIVLLNKKQESRYVAGSMNYTPYGPQHRRLWGYRTTLFDRIYQPGYYVTDTKYFWESNFFDMRNQQLLYSAQTESFDPATSESMAHEYGELIVANMVKQAVLLKQINSKETGD